MIIAVLFAAIGSQAAPLQWSDIYWAKQAEFQRCFKRELGVLEKRELPAKKTLDGVLVACKPQWDARVDALVADIVRQRPDWSSERVDGFVDRLVSDWYDVRLDILQREYGEIPTRVDY